MIREVPKEMPQWASDLVVDLEARKHNHGGCEHSRSAYSDAAYMVIDYWEERDDADD